MIKRFEDEYPETRLRPELNTTSLDTSITTPIIGRPSSSPAERPDPILSDNEAGAFSADEDASPSTLRPNLSMSRHNSDVSLASRALTSEEGMFHRFGQAFRRDIIQAEKESNATDGSQSASTNGGTWAPHLEMLRATIEEVGGEEIRRKVQEGGEKAVLKELVDEAGELRRQIIESDPVGWTKFVEAQELAERNRKMSRSDAIEDGGVVESAIVD